VVSDFGVTGVWLVIFIFISQMCRGWCVHFRGGLHVVWVGSCQWLYLVGMGVCVYVDVYVWLLGLAREI